MPNVNRLAAAVRRTGGKVFWNETSPITWSQWRNMMTPLVRETLVKNLAPWSCGHAIHPRFEVKLESEVVQKHRFGAFLQGSSELPQRLSARATTRC